MLLVVVLSVYIHVDIYPPARSGMIQAVLVPHHGSINAMG
jgi:hypothetical protein